MTIDAITGAGAQATALSRAKLSENFDTFLTLLTAQLSNQDPLNPVDSAAFTQQLVQYSQVEQQIETNDQLKSLLDQSAASSGAAAVAYIGKSAVLDSDATTLADGAASWAYDVSGASGPVKLSVRDAGGKEVFAMTVPAASGGQVFNWDGENAAGVAQKDGVYRLAITASDSDGEAIAPVINVTETITGIDFATASPTLITVSGQRNFESILTIRN
ncbi:MAG: flagellar hook capping FlgD N-terminal domain-containing protein [Hyphomonadaceae bacterium]|nr:flagellar hook capping FlgD N-terminal domain-containing protein [Hyphomonadaceae bacterium]